MDRIFLACILLVSVTSTSLADRDETPLQSMPIHDRGIGPIEIGMTIEEASRVLEFDLETADHVYGSHDCRSFSFGERFDWEYRILAEDGRIARVDIYTPLSRLENGLGVGSMRREIMGTYPEGTLKRVHEPSWRAVHVPLDNGNAYRFVGSEIKTATLRVGDMAAGTVEGCL